MVLKKNGNVSFVVSNTKKKAHNKMKAIVLYRY